MANPGSNRYHGHGQHIPSFPVWGTSPLFPTDRRQRVVFKSSYVSPSKLRRHISYLERESACADGKKPEVFTEKGKDISIQPMDNEPRTYRFILSPENGDRLDMKHFTREFMEHYEKKAAS